VQSHIIMLKKEFDVRENAAGYDISSLKGVYNAQKPPTILEHFPTLTGPRIYLKTTR
jgi:hypothetical protein